MDNAMEILQNENVDDKQECKGNRKKKKVFLLSGIVVLIMIMIIAFLKCGVIPRYKYNQALSLLEDKEYLKSYNLFKGLGNYKDSECIIKNFRFLPKQIKEYDSERERNTMECIYNADNNYLKVINSYYAPTVIQYTFDDNGNCIKVKEDEYIREYWYDGDGNCIKKISPYEEITYKYDDRGNLIEKKDNSGENIYTTEYIYDDKNNCIREVWYRNSSNSAVVTEYTYDEYGNRIKEEKINEEGQHELIEEYSYDERGNCIHSFDPNVHRIFNIEGPARTIKNTYNDNGKCLKEIVIFSYDTGAFDENVTEYVYDRKGNCVEEIHKSKCYNDEKIETAASESKIEYVYDENGNCIKKVDTSKYGTDYTEYKDYFIIYARQDLESFKETDI